MRFVVAGGGVAGLAAALTLARAGHAAVVLERDPVEPGDDPGGAFDVERRGIPHYFQPHTFLPRGRQVLRRAAPDVVDALLDAGAEEQDLACKLSGPREPGDEDLVYLWVRRPVIEWALRRAAAAEPGVELRTGVTVAGLLTDGDGAAAGVGLAGGEAVRGDVVVDALGRYRCPPGWPRPTAEHTDVGAVYYCRYFRLADGAEHLEGPWLLNPRGDLGYMAFNTFRGDNRTFAVILLVPAADRALRPLRDEAAWTEACRSIRPLDAMTDPAHAAPITGVMPMGGLTNVVRDGDPGVPRVVAVGDAFCHTNPAYAFGLSFAVAHAEALARAAEAASGADEVAHAYRSDVADEARERHRFACESDDARVRHWAGERLDMSRPDGCYPLFAFNAALAAAPHDDLVLRRTVRRIGLLDRTAVFDADAELHRRIQAIFSGLTANGVPRPGPERDEMLARVLDAAGGPRTAAAAPPSAGPARS